MTTRPRLTLQAILDADEDSPLAFHVEDGLDSVAGQFEIVYERGGPGGVVAYRCQGDGFDRSRRRCRVQFDLVAHPGGPWKVENITIKRR